MKNRKQAFTLIELIVVMGIVGILAAGGLAAFTMTAKSGRLDQARETVTTVVRSARSYAVSNDRNVLLVFNTNVTSVHNGSLRDERGNRAMAVFDPIENDYVTEWINMPGGVFFKDTFGMIASERKDIAYEGTTKSMPWIWVKSDGTILKPALAPEYRLRIEEGIPRSDNTAAYDVHPSGRFKEIRINWLNGSITTINSSAGDQD